MRTLRSRFAVAILGLLQLVWLPGARAQQPSEAPTTLVILGATGDLSRRKLFPGLFQLEQKARLPAGLKIVGVGRRPIESDVFVKSLRDRVQELGEVDVNSAQWRSIEARTSYLASDPRRVGQALESIPGRRVIYFALPPEVYPMVAGGLKGRVRPSDRLMIEKPFGDSASSAGKLQRLFGEVAPPSQVALVDHYLAKDAVLMLGKLRRDRRLRPVLDREHVESITVRALESAGVAGRGSFYDRVGAVRDMVQGHLLQVLSTTIMDRPRNLTAGALGSAKARVLRKARVRRLVRGQYGQGMLNGKAVPGYRSEPGVRPDSTTETYAALALEVDSPRWRGVPMILEAGKALPDNVKEVEIRFRRLPRELLRSSGCTLRTAPAGRLTIDLASARVSLRVGRRVIGLKTDLGAEPRMQAYARLLDHALRKDDSPAVFARMDETIAAWNLLDPVLGRQAPRTYRAGSRSALRAARRRLRPYRGIHGSHLPGSTAPGRATEPQAGSGRRVQMR